ncbi:MAG: DUF5693 family protein [Candidatus Caldatribacteriota bacterium]
MATEKRISLFHIFIIIALIIAVVVIYQRVEREGDFKQVELVMSLNELRELATQEGIEESELLTKIKKVGITSIAIHEDTLESLSLLGKIVYFTDTEFNKLNFFLKSLNLSLEHLSHKGENYVIVNNQDDYLRIKENLQRQLGEEAIKELPFLPFRGLIIKGGADKISKLGLGFSMEDIDLVKSFGFQVILRPQNMLKITKENLDYRFREMKKIGEISGLIFEGESVLGYPSREDLLYTADLIKKNNYPFGMIEFAGQKGIEVLAQSSPLLLTRVHSITKEEMEIISKQKAIDRWIRAAQERNVRVFYLKPFLKVKAELIEENLSYLTTIKSELEKSGFIPGKASLFSLSFITSKLFIFLLTLGVISGGILLLKKIIQLKKGQEYLLLLCGLLFSLLLLLLHRELFLAKLMALLSALIFPTLAIVSNQKYFLGNSEIKLKANPSLLSLISQTIQGFVRIIIISLVGAILIAAILSSNKFMLGIDLFSGIKISYLLPLFMVMVILWWKSNRDKYILLRELKQPLLMEHLVIMAFFAIFLVIYIARSGNFSFLPVLSIEEKIRIFLEKTLIARPRNKEFLIGYPALFLAMAMNFLKLKDFKLPIIVIGTVGPVTLINTFCHIHTPFLFSLLRTFNGIWLGWLLGIILIIILYFSVKIFRGINEREKT